MIKRVVMKASCAAAIAILFNPLVQAGSYVVDGLSTCTSLNCASVLLRGSYSSVGTGAGIGDTWVYQVFASKGACLRIQVTSGIDTEMAVVSPDPAASGAAPEGIGNIWADDDSAGGDDPLIKIDPVPRAGRYTIVVSKFDDTPGGVSFDVRYGLYNSGNVNCASPTPVGGLGFAASASEDAFVEDKTD